MSNLYKQHFAMEKSGAVPRVIDSNELIRQKLEEQAQALLPKTESSGGFKAGIAGIESGELPEGYDGDAMSGDAGEEGFAPGLEEYMAAARSEADRLLAEARGQAEQLLAEARTESGQIRETAKAEGRDAGYAQGMEEANRQLEEERRQLRQREADMREELRQQQEQMEPRLVEVITELVEQVFHVQFHDKEEILLYLVRSTLESIDGGKNFIIRTCMERAAYLEEHRQEIADCLGRGVTLDIIGEHSMGEGDCIIETENGLFECGPDVQMENLVKDIKSLCLRG